MADVGYGRGQTYPTGDDFSYMAPTYYDGNEYVHGTDGKLYVLDPTTGAQSLASEDQARSYMSQYGGNYVIDDYVAPPEPAPAPAPAPMPQMPQPRPMQKMRRMQKFAGNFGMGTGGDEFRYDPFAQNPKSNTGSKGIVNSLMGGSPFKLTQPGGGKNPYGGK